MPDAGPRFPVHAASARGAPGRTSNRGKTGGRNVPSALDRCRVRWPDDRVHLGVFMTIPSLVEWIQRTDLSIAIREGGLPYPIIGGLHLLSIALFGGMLMATDLRLLGWAMQRRPFADVWYQFRPWKRLGFVMVVATGLLLAWAEPVRLYRSPSFWVKMSLFALVGLQDRKSV